MESSDEVALISDQTILVFNWIIFTFVCQIISIFGIITNIMNIICFVKQGFDDSVNISLLALGVSDLSSLITMVWSCISMTPAMLETSLPIDPIDIAYLVSAMPHFAFTRVSGCITAYITLERCLCVTYPLKIKSLITPKRTAFITVGMFIVFISSGSPVYVVNSLGMTFSATRNRTLFGLVATEDRENVEKFSFIINNFMIPFVAFVIIVVCTAILSFKLRRSTKWRQKTITGSQIDNVSSRNQKAAKMVVMISTLFIVCFIPCNIIVLVMGLLPSISITGKQVNITVVIAGIGYVMESLNSSMNIFIYYRMSSKYRDNLPTFCKNKKTINSI